MHSISPHRVTIIHPRTHHIWYKKYKHKQINFTHTQSILSKHSKWTSDTVDQTCELLKWSCNHIKLHNATLDSSAHNIQCLLLRRDHTTSDNDTHQFAVVVFSTCVLCPNSVTLVNSTFLTIITAHDNHSVPTHRQTAVYKGYCFLEDCRKPGS